ncbi:MAG: hypothetical protein Q9159_007553 [Coniocarpon cinnabarinum]
MAFSESGRLDHEGDEVAALPTSPSVLYNDSFVMLSDEGNDSKAYTPPAALAARFHPAKTNRRRSSQASSRRNSLTSSHSHYSARSLRSVHQNHYIAQHLRRTSIIESRKQKLAERAAHAEQVRLRAALAKAAPRTSHTEERAIAAQQAREQRLAQLAAAAAEEVARSKKVAEEHKERQAEEERKARLQFEEKHAEAERRRAEYARVTRKARSRSSAAPEGKITGELQKSDVSLEWAVRKIQAVWRQHKQRLVMRGFLGLNLTTRILEEMDFVEASKMLADAHVVELARQVMRQLRLDVDSLHDLSTVRRLLSAYMILSHATEVFNKHGQQEDDLTSKAQGLLFSFEATTALLASPTTRTAPETQMQTLAQAYASYCTTFEAWKTQDKSVLIDTMVAQFVAFDSIWQTVKDDSRGEVANDYRDAIRDQQIILLSKIKRLAGPENANRKIKHGIRESRRQRRHQRPTTELRPRPISDDVSREAAAQGVASPVAAEDQTGTDVAAAPSHDQLSRIFSVVPPNRKLVHELMIDPSYRIEVSPQSDTRSALNREVCAGMRRAIDKDEGDIWTVAVAESIRTRLLKLLKPGNSMHTLLSEFLDPQMIREKCARNQFSHEDFFDFMANLLPRLCAPFRDEEVKALGEVLTRKGDGVDSMIEKLFGLLHVIDVMSLDYTNYMLQQAAPTLIQEGAGYEARAFDQDLQGGTTTLQRTKCWWRNATVMTFTEASAHDTPTHPSSAATVPRIYARGLADLAIGTGFINENDLPETLHMDWERLSRIRQDSLRFTTVGAVLLTAKNLLRRDVRSQWKPEAKRICDAIRDSDGNSDGDLATRMLAIISATHGMPQSSYAHLSEVAGRILMNMRTGQVTDPVLKLLNQRLRTHIFNRLAATSATERVRVASTTSEALAGIGLSEFVGQIGELAEELSKIAKVDKNAHFAVYQQVVQEIEADGAGPVMGS